MRIIEPAIRFCLRRVLIPGPECGALFRPFSRRAEVHAAGAGEHMERIGEVSKQTPTLATVPAIHAYHAITIFSENLTPLLRQLVRPPGASA